MGAKSTTTSNHPSTPTEVEPWKVGLLSQEPASDLDVTAQQYHRAPYEIIQPFMSNGQLKLCPMNQFMNQFNARISRKVYKIVYFG